MKNILTKIGVELNKKYSSKTEMTKNHLAVLKEIFNKTKKEEKLSNLEILKSTEQKLEELSNNSDNRIPSNLVSKLNKLYSSIDTNKTILTSFTHFDFTVCNTYDNEDNLAFYDWALAQEHIPAFFDTFHYIFKTNIFVNMKNWSAIKTDINKNLANIENKLDIQEYLKLYLLINVTSQLHLLAQQKEWQLQTEKLIDVWNYSVSDVLTEILDCRKTFIGDFMDKLNNKEYALIKNPEFGISELNEYSDIDISIKKGDYESISTYLNNHPFISKVNIHKKTFMSSVTIFLENKTKLNINLIWKFKRKQLEFLSISDALKTAKRNNENIKVLNNYYSGKFIGLYYGLNNIKIPNKYKKYGVAFVKSENKLEKLLSKVFFENQIDNKEITETIANFRLNKSVNGFVNKLDYIKDVVSQFTNKNRVKNSYL